MLSNLFTLIILFIYLLHAEGGQQHGPDPWDYGSTSSSTKNKPYVPSDLKGDRQATTADVRSSIGDTFFKSLLVVMVRGGQIQKNDDNSVDVSIKLHLPPDHWTQLNEYISSNVVMTEEMYRRTMGYIQEDIYKPKITEKISVAWRENVLSQLTIYQVEIKWLSWVLAGCAVIYFLAIKVHLSRRNIIILIVAGLFLYESLITYKEAEEMEYQKFISAVSTCKWFFWSKSCDLPMPDPLLFIKHMHPLKIGLRLFTMFITEPILQMSTTVKTLSYNLTEGLFWPLREIIYGLVVFGFTALIIVMLIILPFTLLFNTSFNVSFLTGLFSIGVGEGNAGGLTANRFAPSQQSSIANTTDSLSGVNLDRFLKAMSSKSIGFRPNNAGSHKPKSITASAVGKRRPSKNAKTNKLHTDKKEIGDGDQ